MVADVEIAHDFGGTDTNPSNSPTITSCKWKTADNATDDSLDPVPIPPDATDKNSFWKQIYLRVGATPPDTRIDNLKFYSDTASYGTGVTLFVGDEFPTKTLASDAGYEVATGVVGDTGDEVVANHAGISNLTDALSFVQTSNELDGPTIGEASNEMTATGHTSNYLVFQLEVDQTASAGITPTATLTIQYDEI